MRVVSSPAPGSVTPKHTCRSPLTMRGRVRGLSSSEPCLTTGCMPKIDRWMALAPFIAAAGARDLLEQQRRLGDAQTVPAVLLRDRHAEPAALGDRVVELLRELVRLVLLHPVLVVEPLHSSATDLRISS